MSLLNYLEFQPIDSSAEDISTEHLPQNEINLNEPVDELSLEKFWDQVVQDIHEDPEWFSFDNE